MLRCPLHPETFVTRLTDTQTRILTSAASRPGMLAMPLPKGLHGAAAKKVVTLMTESGLIEEVEADLRHEELLWRETGDGHGTTLVATEVGLAAIGTESGRGAGHGRFAEARSGPAGVCAGRAAQGHQAGGVDRAFENARWCQYSRDHRRDRLAGSFRARGHLGSTEEEAGVGCHLGEGRGPGAGVPHRRAGRRAQRRC